MPNPCLSAGAQVAWEPGAPGAGGFAAAVVAPYRYLSLVWATALGWTIWGDLMQPVLGGEAASRLIETVLAIEKVAGVRALGALLRRG